MKKIFLFAASAILIGTLFLSSCAKQDDPNTTPASTDPRERFHGNWYIHENSIDNGPATYYVNIVDSTNASYIMFAYLYGYNKKVYATYSGNNFTIPSQTIQGQIISGSGTLVNASTINMNYAVRTTGTHTDNVTATLTK